VEKGLPEFKNKGIAYGNTETEGKVIKEYTIEKNEGLLQMIIHRR
jgi:hypothetical protein